MISSSDTHSTCYFTHRQQSVSRMHDAVDAYYPSRLNACGRQRQWQSMAGSGRWYLVELVGGDDLDQVLHCVLDLHVLALVDNAQHHSPQLSGPSTDGAAMER